MEEREPEGVRWIWEQRGLPKWFWRAVLYVLVGLALFTITRAVVTALRELLIMLFVSAFLSFAIEPAVDWLADRGWRRGAATGLVFVVVTVVGGTMVWLVVDLLVRQVSDLVADAPHLIRNATDWVNRRFDANITSDKIVEQVRRYQGDIASTAGNVGGRVLSVTGSFLGVVFQGLTVGLFSFYLVADGPKLRRSICSVLPPTRQRMVLELWELAINKTGGYLYSRAVLAAVSATAATIGFSIIGLPSPFALAIWLGVVSQFVPVIGTYIGGALPVLIALLTDPIDALWVLVFLVVYQQLENYLLAPRITAKTMDIHPAVAFGAAFAGVAVIGPIGALLALPVAAIIQAFVSSYLHRYELVPEVSDDETALGPVGTGGHAAAPAVDAGDALRETGGAEDSARAPDEPAP